MPKIKKTQSPSSNTLYNYFSKTPPANKKARLQNGESSNNQRDPRNDNNKRGRDSPLSSEPLSLRYSDNEPEASSSDSIPASTSGIMRKRIRLNPMDSDDDEVISMEKETTEQKLNKSFRYELNQSRQVKKADSISETGLGLVDSGRSDSSPSTGWPLTAAPSRAGPSTAGPSTAGPSTAGPSTAGPSTAEPLTAGPSTAGPSYTGPSDEQDWTHCKLEWLKPHGIRDAQKRKPDHPDYDPTTLFVPPKFLNEQTPAHKQWWEMKSSHFDCVLFFKVGKFYELYHMDAAVGVNELGFSYMKGEFAHSGFPESAYSRMASTLVQKGYKVARVEQTETPEMMQQRCKKGNRVVDKVVRREICQVTVRGTQVCGLQDAGPDGATSQYMMAIAEEASLDCSTYGVCFVDTSIGTFHLGQFKDDRHSSRLLTTFAHYPPVLIVYDRKSTTPRTSKLISTHCPSARLETLTMWQADKTLKTLADKYYKTDTDRDWPKGFEQFLNEGDILGLTPAANCSLAIKALGGCVSYLTNCLLDIQILGMSQFAPYDPPDVLNQTLAQEDKREIGRQAKWQGGTVMVLDAITLRNLRIVQDEGCLYDKLNFCSTAMGKRLLYQWVCAPSCDLSIINERQEAIHSLLNNQGVLQDARNILATLPDLERLLAKVHSLGNSLKSKTHPDSRAIFYEEKIYSKRNMTDFITVLNGLKAALKLGQLFMNTESRLLSRLMRSAPHGKFPDYSETLKSFMDVIDKSEGEMEARFVPENGVDPQYDAIMDRISHIEEQFKDYLAVQERHFRCRVVYAQSAQKRYHLEVAASAEHRAGADYQLESARKGFKRYSTAHTRELLSRLQAAEDEKKVVLKDLSRRIFEKFSSEYNQWQTAVQSLATLDVLLSLTEFARQQNGEICKPQLTYDKNTKPYIKIVEGRHPCISVADGFIPNGAELGGAGPALLVLTGPNMGGKSTYMRQVGLITVLAHLGSYVPAQECSISLVDRIFTRVGASDDIFSGQSTFMVEMNETAAILNHATEHSLVLIDELGRGTSTRDGAAIASAVCVELAALACRVYFSTHYSSVSRDLATHPRVVLGHMACVVEDCDDNISDSEDISNELITFQYRLAPGACPKSYGFNAARLAGIPIGIIRNAHQISRNMEREDACALALEQIIKQLCPLKV